MASIAEIHRELNTLKKSFKGSIATDITNRLLFSTDASAYREIPYAVVFPLDKDDIKAVVRFAAGKKIPIIPRTAGTSLAGQVVGKAIIVDISRSFGEILELNTKESWVRVEPGVILDVLNNYLKPYHLFFGPETSTANRCMIGGMLGNNACGSHSLIYGSTREHTLEVNAILSDGEEVVFKDLSSKGFFEKCKLNSREGDIYRNLKSILSDKNNRNEIIKEYPHPDIKRRNTAYALDLLALSQPFEPEGPPLNLSKLIAGSEGTLAFITEIKLNLVPLPPKHKALLCVHFHSLEDAFRANLIALKHKPGAVELMDGTILELTKENPTQNKNRFFIKGNPQAILIIEFARDTEQELLKAAQDTEAQMREEGLGYFFPLIREEKISRVWDLRKAGLGVLSNMPGDAKPVSVIEDTAVRPEDLPAYMDDFKKILDKHKLKCVYHAHIGTGELHLRPVLNLKDPKDVELFRIIAKETAELVKRYKGSLSGEHGDGRLRGEFIPLMIGEKNYQFIQQIKSCWDPDAIFNPKKIIHTPPMNTSLRYEAGKTHREFDTVFDFSANQGILRAAEQCNGSGDCRKTALSNGGMCPSYMASREEKDSTRARANILREFLTNSTKTNPFNHKEIYEVMDLCLSCKACKSECPSNVDITKLKAEFLQHYYDENGAPTRAKMIANITSFNKMGMLFPAFYNFFLKNKFTSLIFKKLLNFAPKRSIPLLYKISLKRWYKKNAKKHSPLHPKKSVYLFADEFTNYNDTEIGIKALKLLWELGYNVDIPEHKQSGRAFLSKGFLRKAQKIAQKNIGLLGGMVSADKPLIGIEPSGILCFRDEYPDLLKGEEKEIALKLSKSSLLFDEFIVKEIEEGNITPEMFTTGEADIKYHGHCHQKALASTESGIKMLSLPANYHVEEIKSGCCGMAGAFGYEKEHYDISMKVGELVLFPAVREASKETIICAAGTSCRHQIKDGTGRRALHPIEILYDALKNKGQQ